MKKLLIAFLLCLVVLGLQFSLQSEPDVFADGRLACAPLPPEFAPMATGAQSRSVAAIAEAAAPPALSSTAAHIAIAEPEPGNEQLAEVRRADRSDWGIPQIPAREPLTLATAPPPRLVHSAVTTVPEDSPPPATTSTVVANLYLPEGATDESGALMTLVKPELQVFEGPDVQSPPAPFLMKQGEKVRPLARIRNDGDFDWIRIERDGRTFWAQAEYFIRVDPRNRTDIPRGNLPVGLEAVDKDSALPPDYQPNDMMSVPRQLVMDGRDIKLRLETCEALQRMIYDAAKQGLTLRIFSGYRDFEYQRKLYLDSIQLQGPKQNGTAAPGYSEHQLGTTIDICNADKRYVLRQEFAETPEGRWLRDNLDRYGFRFSYTQENTDESGYRFEPWHLRYVGPENAAPAGTRLAAAWR
jgi:LAS superfamily LD-carboxypeptidase LdcB